MRARIGYQVMKRLTRRRGDPITDALTGVPGSDPSVVALVERLRVAAGREEAVPVVAPLEAITEAVFSGPSPSETDLQPVVHSIRRRLVRVATTAGLAAKMLFGAAALAAVAATAAVTGSLPDPVQDFVSDTVDNVGIEIPRGNEETGPPTDLPDPASPVPGDRIDHRDAVVEYNRCVVDARLAHIAENGNAGGFDATLACGERPDGAEFGTPDAPGLSDSPADTRPTGVPESPGSPADTRPGRP